MSVPPPDETPDQPEVAPQVPPPPDAPQPEQAHPDQPPQPEQYPVNADPYAQPAPGYPQAGYPQGGYPQTGYPQAGYAPAGYAKPDNYLVWAILTMILCCLPLGIVSLVYATQVDSKWSAGDVAGAENSSQQARTWAIWSAVAGIAFTVLIVIFVVLLPLLGLLPFMFMDPSTGSSTR